MAVQQGMDTARIRQIASRLETQADKLADIVARGGTSANVLSANWAGADVRRMLTTWQDEASRQLTAASDTVRQASRALVRNADDQDDTSDVVGGGSGGPGGPAGPGGPGGPGESPGGPGGDPTEETKVTKGNIEYPGRDAPWVKVNTDGSGGKHYYDPVTGKRWQESPGGTYESSQDRFGHDSDTRKGPVGDTGWDRESTRGDGGGHREYGEKWSKEKSFDDNIGQDVKKVTDNVRSEPIVEQKLWEEGGEKQWVSARAGDEQTGASIALAEAKARTEGTAGIDATRGAYVEAAAEAGVYLGKGEAHYGNEHGTQAQVEGYVAGAEAEASGTAQIGPGGAKVDLGVEAFAGGKIEGGVSQDLGPAEVGVAGELSYGIGAHADIDAEAGWGKVGVEVDVGATLGIGGGVKFDVSVSPKEIVDGLGDAGQAIADSELNPANWW
ncbi:WXG100 family type VII secretion target [Janibacter terrae]|uniref:hypothetical protein n=1 Tax=Janibacter terrae TaxID=103817 RepID=UPI00382ECC82